MATEPTDTHWFAGKDVDVLIFRVNRRPIGDPMLFAPPRSLLSHLRRVLSADRDHPVRSGRRYQREWRVGNLVVGAGTLTGMIGWSRSGIALSNMYDPVSGEWRDTVVPTDVAAVSPFALTTNLRFLGVLKHPEFTEKTLAHVFTELLNRGEQSLDMPTVAWAVEPVGDRAGFDEWVASTEAITQVKFVFRRPNPDAEPEFEHLFERLDALKAEQIVEQVTALDKNTGLDKDALREDETTQGFISAAMVAFGYVTGRGYRQGKETKYDQRRSARRETVRSLPADWEGARDKVLRAVRKVTKREQDG